MTLAQDLNNARGLIEVEASLRQREEELRTVIQNTPVILWTVNADRVVEEAMGGGLQALNPAGLSIGPSSVERRKEVPGAGEALERAFGGEPASTDADNLGRTYAVTYTPVLGNDGKVSRVIGTAWDVTEERQAAAALSSMNADLEQRVAERTAALDRALADLRESEQRYRQFIEDSPDGITRIDLEGRLMYASPAYLKMTGFTWEEIEGTSIADYMEPEARASLPVSLDYFRTSEEPRRARGRARRKDGSYYWYEAVSVSWRDPDAGKVAVIHSIARDISEQVRMEEALRHSEERYRLLAEESNDLIATYDTAGTYTYASPSAERVLGYEPEVLLGKNAFEFVHPDDREATMTRVLDAAREKRSQVTLLYRVCRGDGEIAWLESSVRPVRDPLTGKVTHYHLIARDVTDRVRAEEALRESEDRYRLLAEESSDVIGAFDRDGTYLYASPSADKILGHPAADLVGRNALDFMHEDDRERALATVREAAQKREPQVKVAYRVCKPDETVAWVESSIHIVRDPDTNRLIRFHLVARDISEQVRTEEALRESEALFRLLADNAATLIARIAPDGTLLYVSPSIQPVLGYAPEDVIGKRLSDYLLPDEPRQANPAASRFPTTLLHRAVHAQGHVVWLETNIRAVYRDGAPAPAEYHASAREVTARVHAEQALRESEERYRHLAEDSTDIIARFGRGGVWQYASPAVTRILGYEPDELLGTTVYDLLPAEDAEHITQLEINGATQPVTLLHRAEHKEHRDVWLETSIRPLTDTGIGETTGYHVTSRDVSHRVSVENALRESEERFRLLAENSTDLVARHDQNGVYLYVSPAVKTITGYEPSELVGHNSLEFIKRQDYRRVLTAMRALVPGSVCQVTYRSRHKSGAWIWLEASVRAVCDPATGEVTEWHSSARDVTDRHRSQELLTASEERYRLLAEHSADMVSIIRPDGHFIYVSPSSARMTGYAPEELIGQRDALLIHPEDYPLANAAVAEARRNGGISCVRLRTVRKDGGVIWTETVARVVGEREDDLRIYTVTRDVTRSVLSEQALRESEELFRRIFDESPIPMVLSDAKGRFAKVNDAYCDLLGYSREELLAMSDARFVHPDEVGKAREGSKKIFSGELSRIHREKRYRRSDGRELVGMLTAAPIHDGSANVVYLLSIIEDITAQKRASEELSRIAAMKSDFVTLVSHELRAPLTNMRGGLELIAHDAPRLPVTARRTLSILTSETSRLNRFVETILDVSRLDAGQLPIVLGPVAVNVVIDRATRASLLAGHSAPQTFCAPHLPLAWADELQLEHVLRNLIANASYHSEPGQRPLVSAEVRDGRIVISVTDHGPGISAEDLPHVFDAFHRSAGSDLRYKGYGLGLYFARRLIEEVGGDIRVESPVAGDPRCHGARFTVVLPAAVPGG